MKIVSLLLIVISRWNDVEDARDENFSNSMYIILNLCMVFGYVRDNLILSKREGGEWAIQNIQQKFCRLVNDALIEYKTNKTLSISCDIALDFTDYMLQEISKLK